MFSIGDLIVHPMHGAGVIDDIVREKVAGVWKEYYVFKMPVGGLVLCSNYIRNCFSLSEIHLAVHKSATGEFARACRSCTGIQKKTEDCLDDVA